MKIDILQVENAKFKKWHWWSYWYDVAVFDFESTPFLLQMRIDRMNRKKFNAIRITGTFVYRQAKCTEIGDLIPMQKVYLIENS